MKIRLIFLLTLIVSSSALFAQGKVIWPFGKADKPTLITSGVDTLTLLNAEGGSTINNQFTIQKFSLTGNLTLNIVPSSELRVGAILEFWITSDTTARSIIPGTGFSSGHPNIVGVISKTVKVLLIYDGSTFSQSAPKIQIN